MGLWNMLRCEPSLDELLADEMMAAVARSAGTDRAGLRQMLQDLIRRLPADRLAALKPRCAPPAAACHQPSAA